MQAAVSVSFFGTSQERWQRLKYTGSNIAPTKGKRQPSLNIINYGNENLFTTLSRFCKTAYSRAERDGATKFAECVMQEKGQGMRALCNFVMALFEKERAIPLYSTLNFFSSF